MKQTPYLPLSGHRRTLSAPGANMKGAVRERWLMLCEQAAVEQDPKRLLLLIREINDLLEEKRKRLDKR
jgi:hypothetical protein